MSEHEHIAIVLTPSGPIIGVLEELEAGFYLKKPRGLAVQQAGAGLVKIGFSDLIGKPDVVTFTGDIAFYKPMDQTVAKGYLEATSGIKLVTTMPPHRTN